MKIFIGYLVIIVISILSLPFIVFHVFSITGRDLADVFIEKVSDMTYKE